MYNKTALNKIKKADLIALFLDQQAEKNQLVLDAEENKKLKDQLNFMFPSKDAENIIAKYQVDRTNRLIEIKELKAENEKLKTDIDYLKHQKSIQGDKLKEFMDEINKLNQQNDYAYKQINELMSKINLSTI